MEWIPVPTNTQLSPFKFKPHTNFVPPTAADLVDVRVSNQQIAVDFAANLGIGTIFNSSASSNEVGYWLEAMAYTDDFEQLPQTSGEIIANRFGAGIRIMFRVQVLKAKANLNLAFLGASLDAQYATASYEVDGIGLGANALPTILAGLSASGTLTGQELYKLNTTVLTELTKYIKENRDQLQPQRVAALTASPKPGTSLDVSAVVLYSKRQIGKGRKLRQALDDAGSLDPATISWVYADALKTPDATVSPNSVQRQAANDWLANN